MLFPRLIFLSLLSFHFQPPLHPQPIFKPAQTTDNWVTVPTNSILTIHKQTVLIHPILDQYYNENPSYVRSSGFAVSKGLVGATAEQPDDEAESAMGNTRRARGKENDPFP